MSGAELAPFVSGIAFAYLAGVSIVLVVIDLSSHRLPNRVVLPSYVVALLLFAAASALTADPGRLLRTVAGMVILFACYFAMRLASPGSLGGGDVKLAGLLGLYFGWIGWSAILIGTAAAFLIGGTQAIAMILMRRADRRTRIAFGPAMLAGAWVAIIAAALPTLLPTPPGS
ncbi:A24 family peptidase [Microbacterium terregens]|uniref:Prepilin peptidase n=1 Tax=Microbacterium terregens TaxID=69363 RepID=A0ABV5T0M3_9MICO